MKTMKITTALRNLALIGSASLALTGCMTQEEKSSDFSSDGQGAFLVTETDQMGQTMSELPTGTLGKPSAAPLTIEGELVIDPFAYMADCACFVRRAHFTGHKGYERIRLDSVTLLDSAGATMDKFKPASIAKVVYRRNVDHSKGAKEVQVRIDLTIDIKTEGATKLGVWNGTMTGTFNGQEFKSATITNVSRSFLDGRFRFPETGTIELTRPVYHFLVEFLGEGKAKVTVKNRLNGRIHILWVDKTYKETAPVAE